MRIWDISPQFLSVQHLLGEHRELHAIWIYLTTEKGSNYRKHPETLRWQGKLPALFNRHNALVEEMKARGFKHQSPLTPCEGSSIQDMFINTIEEQQLILLKKNPAWYAQWNWK